MLAIFAASPTCLNPLEIPPSEACATAHGPLIWYDLNKPTAEEDREVERLLGVSVPTREEMQEIETSSRLYAENNSLYMTATLTCRADTPEPITTPVTFILTGKALATVRYDDPLPFAQLTARVQKPGAGLLTGTQVLLSLLESIIDRAADVLERVGAELDDISRQVFDLKDDRGRRKIIDYDRSLKMIGRAGTLVGKVEESLVSIQRLLLFLANETEVDILSKDQRALIKVMQRDIKSISDFALSLDSKLSFVLDATLGLVSLQQNNIVKIFSILAVIFLPPTLIASIYGMNFEVMPELKWSLGYPFALSLMVASVALTFAVFRWRKWL